MRRALVTAATLILAAPAAALTGVKPAPPPPPYAGVYQPQGVDEIGLWHDLDEEERKLSNSPLVIRDEALNGYVRQVLCSAVGADRCAAARIYLIHTAEVNAAMSPNGMVMIYSGLLLRMRSEAELAGVLSHEFGHFERRHSLADFKARRSSTDLLSWASLLAGMSGSYQARTNYNNLQVSVVGGVYRHRRDQEREADLLGVGYLNASSLRPQAMAAFFHDGMAEAEASATVRGLKKPRFDAIGFLDDHPSDAERAAYLDALAVPDGTTRDDGAERYRRALAPWLPIFLNDQIKRNDFGASDYLITELAETGWTASLWSARGDLYRARGNPRDLIAAADFYAHAVALDPAFADAYRGLGLSLLKIGRPSDGADALARYLQLRPDAPDAAMIALTATSAKAPR